MTELEKAWLHFWALTDMDAPGGPDEETARMMRLAFNVGFLDGVARAPHVSITALRKEIAEQSIEGARKILGLER
jgi:hypothetical protein